MLFCMLVGLAEWIFMCVCTFVVLYICGCLCVWIYRWLYVYIQLNGYIWLYLICIFIFACVCDRVSAYHCASLRILIRFCDYLYAYRRVSVRVKAHCLKVYFRLSGYKFIHIRVYVCVHVCVCVCVCMFVWYLCDITFLFLFFFSHMIPFQAFLQMHGIFSYSFYLRCFSSFPASFNLLAHFYEYSHIYFRIKFSLILANYYIEPIRMTLKNTPTPSP